MACGTCIEKLIAFHESEIARLQKKIEHYKDMPGDVSVFEKLIAQHEKKIESNKGLLARPNK